MQIRKLTFFCFAMGMPVSSVCPSSFGTEPHYKCAGKQPSSITLFSNLVRSLWLHDHVLVSRIQVDGVFRELTHQGYLPVFAPHPSLLSGKQV